MKISLVLATIAGFAALSACGESNEDNAVNADMDLTAENYDIPDMNMSTDMNPGAEMNAGTTNMDATSNATETTGTADNMTNSY